MKSGDFMLLLVVLGLGGLVTYLLLRKPASTTVVNNTPAQNCGASYLGVGASVPCALLANGVKDAYNAIAASSVTKTVKSEVSTATSGIKTWEYVVTPVAITHATINEIKRVPGLGWL